MKRTELSEDATSILFLLPFLISGIYGIYLWALRGVSATLPSDVYLSVTRNPYIFLVGFLGVLGGVLIQMSTTEDSARISQLGSLSGILQKIAAASFILAFMMAVYANGFDISGAALDFIVGRFSLVFPALVVLLSYLIVTPVSARSLSSMRLWGILSLLGSTVVLYEVGKRSPIVGLVLSLGLIVLGVFLFLFNSIVKEKPTPA